MDDKTYQNDLLILLAAGCEVSIRKVPNAERYNVFCKWADIGHGYMEATPELAFALARREFLQLVDERQKELTS